jgi:hypothetical protein
MPRPGIICVLALIIFSSPSIRAQLPFYTDDADTTEKRKFHFEFLNEHDVLKRELYPAKRQNTVSFALNYGVTKKLELGINVPVLAIFNAKGTPVRNIFGNGDMLLGMKYKLREERTGSRLPAMAVVFYVKFPTGSTAKQLGSGFTDYWLYGVAQKSLTKKTIFRLNGGILFAGTTSTSVIGIRTTRGRVFTGTGSFTRDFTPRLRLGAELFGAVTSSFQLSKGRLATQLGGNYVLSDRFTRRTR